MAAAASFFFLIFIFSYLFGCTSSQLQYTDLPWRMQVLFFFQLQHAEFLFIACRNFIYCMQKFQLCHVGSSSQPGIERRSPALGVRSLSHWTTRGVPAAVCDQGFLTKVSATECVLDSVPVGAASENSLLSSVFTCPECQSYRTSLKVRHVSSAATQSPTLRSGESNPLQLPSCN